MRRQARIPGAAELFRQTAPAQVTPLSAAPSIRASEAESALATHRPASGRRRHDEKITVYLSSGELVAIEEARLTLRSRYGIAIDRGRLVRAALSIVLADLDNQGRAAALVEHFLADNNRRQQARH